MVELKPGLGAFQIEPSEEPSSYDFTPLPSANSFPSFQNALPLLPVVNDHRALTRLLGLIVKRSGMRKKEVADILGIKEQSLQQYLNGRRSNPSLEWFLKLSEICGFRVKLEAK